MVEKSKLFAVGVVVSLSLAAQCQREKLPFQMRNDVPIKGARFDPNPIWVNVKWIDSADIDFRVISEEISRADRVGSKGYDARLWRDKLRSAYGIWFGDHQYGLNLHRVSCYMAIVGKHDPELWDSKEVKDMRAKVNYGWSFLRTIPPSYEFVRRGYLFNAGDLDYHKFGDLALRLLKRRPLDRSVTIAMVRECYKRPLDVRFETALFSALGRLFKSDEHELGDTQWLALAHRLYGRHHKKASSYETALSILDALILKISDPVERKRLGAIRDEIATEKRGLESPQS